MIDEQYDRWTIWSMKIVKTLITVFSDTVSIFENFSWIDQYMNHVSYSFIVSITPYVHVLWIVSTYSVLYPCIYPVLYACILYCICIPMYPCILYCICISMYLCILYCIFISMYLCILYCICISMYLLQHWVLNLLLSSSLQCMLMFV